MNPMQAPNVGVGGKDHGHRKKVVSIEEAKRKRRKREEDRIVKEIAERAKKLDW